VLQGISAASMAQILTERQAEELYVFFFFSETMFLQVESLEAD
jgi:hypothetical protein